MYVCRMSVVLPCHSYQAYSSLSILRRNDGFSAIPKRPHHCDCSVELGEEGFRFVVCGITRVRLIGVSMGKVASPLHCDCSVILRGKVDRKG